MAPDTPLDQLTDEALAEVSFADLKAIAAHHELDVEAPVSGAKLAAAITTARDAAAEQPPAEAAPPAETPPAADPPAETPPAEDPAAPTPPAEEPPPEDPSKVDTSVAYTADHDFTWSLFHQLLSFKAGQTIDPHCVGPMVSGGAPISAVAEPSD